MRLTKGIEYYNTGTFKDQMQKTQHAPQIIFFAHLYVPENLLDIWNFWEYLT